MKDDEGAPGGNKKNFSRHDGDIRHDISRTILPLEIQAIEDQKKYGKSRKKIFVGNDSWDDLSGRIINAISNPIRLKIVLLLDEQQHKNPGDQDIMDEKGIYRSLKNRYNIKVAGLGQNHLRPLLDAGFIQRESGLRDNESVYIYKIVPGALESLITSLSNLSTTVRSNMGAAEIRSPYLKVLGGVQDQKIFELKETPTLLGRAGEMDADELESLKLDIILDNAYQSVTRVISSQTRESSHAAIFKKDQQWFIEDQGQNHCGTFINEKKISDATKLEDHDIIGLSRGKYGVDLVFRLGTSNNIISNPWIELDNLSWEQQQLVASKMKIILSKVNIDFFLETLDNIIDNIRQIQEIQTLMPLDKIRKPDSYNQEDERWAESIINSIDGEEEPEFKDKLVDHYYQKLRTHKKEK